MGKLHELLAVEGDLSAVATKVTEEAANTFSKKSDHFYGQVRTVSFLNEARAGENTTEEKTIVTTVDEKLDYVRSMVAPYFDAVLQKEATNQEATADLIIDGQTIAHNLPATFLLGLETKLKNLRTMYAAIPTLQPGINWAKNDGAGAGHFIAPATTSFKTEKTVKHKVLVEATKEHRAEIEKWNEDVPVARIDTVATSTMLTPHRKSEILGRLDKLIRGVKKARMRANDTTVVDRSIGKELFDFLHASTD